MSSATISSTSTKNHDQCHYAQNRPNRPDANYDAYIDAANDARSTIICIGITAAITITIIIIIPVTISMVVMNTMMSATRIIATCSTLASHDCHPSATAPLPTDSCKPFEFAFAPSRALFGAGHWRTRSNGGLFASYPKV